MLYVSDFADQAVMLPLAIVVAAALVVMGWWRGVAAWLLIIGSVFGLMLGLKAGLVALSENYGSDYSMSPSGHAAAASVMYGGLAVLLFRGRVSYAVIACVPLVAALIVGYSRVSLGAHSVGEVIAGAVVGCAGVAGLAAAAGPRPKFTSWPLVIASGCTVVALHGLHLPAEEAIRIASSGW
jgi:membrane-associated phospholipid phosphatase